MSASMPLALGAASDLGLLWQEALDNYADITGNSQILTTKHSTSIGEVITEISKMETSFLNQRHDGSGLSRFRRLVSESLEPIEALSEVVAQASKAAFPPSEAIFVAVRYLIKTAKNVSGDYDKLADFFQDVESYLKGIQLWETQVPSIPQLKTAIVLVFSSVLVLCGTYTRYINRKRIVKAFRSLASGEDSDLKNAHQRFQKAVQHGRDIVQNATLSIATELNTKDVHADVRKMLSAAEQTKSSTKELRADTHKMLSSMEHLEQSMSRVTLDARINSQLSTNQEKETALRWLSNLDYEDHQREVFAKHHAGTGKWLLDTGAFQDWVHGTQPSLLWCPGDPGAGKTVMMSTAVCYVEENTPKSDTAIAYVYCDYKESKTQSVSEIWASIIRQFAEQCDPFPAQVQAFCDKFVGKRSYPTDDDYVSLVVYLSGLFRKAFIFVDALDECSEENRERFIDSAAKIQTSVRLFVTSRYSVDLDGRFSQILRIDIIAHQDDIRAFLEHKLSKNPRLRHVSAQDPSLRNEILGKLLEQANGMFLLANLQMDTLCTKRRPLDIRKALGTLPKDVHQFYDACLQRIEQSGDEDKGFALQVLSYVFCARRPISMDELIHALSVDPGATDLLSDALYNKVLVFSVSSGLIRVDETSGRVRLAHHTLHEHLQKFGKTLLADREKDLATACLTYLSFEPFAEGPCHDIESMADRLDRYCFLEYACQHWYSHACNYMDSNMIEAILGFVRDQKRLTTCVQVLHLPRHRIGDWHNKFPRGFTHLHAAGYWGMDRILQHLIQSDMDIDRRDGFGMTPLLWSAKHGHIRTMKWLLNAAANVDAQNSHGETALMLAARYKYEAVVELILGQGANSTTEDVEGWTALHWAIISGHNDIIKKLLSTTTSSQTDKTPHNKALILAAEAGSHATVQMLLDEGAIVDYTDDEGSTPLHWCVPEGHVEASKVLLDHGANPNSRDHYDNTPMHWTVSHPALARLLVSHGANVRATNQDGQSALLWSALAGKMDAVETLIELGADFDDGDKYGFTPLHAAALIGHESMIRLLLEKGADANKLDVDGWTPLDAAALMHGNGVPEILIECTDHGHDVVSKVAKRLEIADMRSLMKEMAIRKSNGSVEVNGFLSNISAHHELRLLALLENGTDINAEDEMCGCTALTYAAWLGQEDTVRLLLDHGASIDLRERSGRTALHWAALSGYPDMVVDLVQRGATIDLKVCGWTAMLLASSRKWRDHIVLFLAENGADLGARDFHGRSALHWSCIHGDKFLAKQLIRLGADVNARDHCGQTALHWAIAAGHSPIANMLLRNNADSKIEASDGLTALHIAAYTGQLDAVKVLFNADQRQARRRTQQGSTDVAVVAYGRTGVDKFGFTALEIAELTSNWEAARFIRCHYADGDAQETEDFEDHKSPTQSRAPPLELCKDEEDDYLTDDGFANGLGKNIMRLEARQWLTEKKAQRDTQASQSLP